MSKPRYDIEKMTKDFILIRDVGPHDSHMTVTNGADDVVRELAESLNGRRLLYIDSMGSMDELLVENGCFAGFSILTPEERKEVQDD